MKKRSIALLLGFVAVLFLSSGCAREVQEAHVPGPGITVVDTDSVRLYDMVPRYGCAGNLLEDSAATNGRKVAVSDSVSIPDSSIRAIGYVWPWSSLEYASDLSSTAEGGGIDLSWLKWLLAILGAFLAIGGALWILSWLWHKRPQSGGTPMPPANSGGNPPAGTPQPPNTAPPTPQAGTGGENTDPPQDGSPGAGEETSDPEMVQEKGVATPSSPSQPEGGQQTSVGGGLPEKEAEIMRMLVDDKTIESASVRTDYVSFCRFPPRQEKTGKQKK